MLTPAFTHLMFQRATYWAPMENDGFGGSVWGAPEVITCRWSEKFDMIKNSQGREVVSSAAVHVERRLELGGRLALGEFVGNDPDEYNAKEIINISAVPSLDATEELVKVWL